MSGKRTTTSIFIITIVIAFLVSSFGLSAFVIWDLIHSKSNNQASNDTQSQTTNQPKEGKLEGTKLAGFQPIENVDQLKIVDLKVGTGEVVKKGDSVVAHYTGALAKDGTIFQSSHDSGDPVPFSLDGVIEGWKEGVPGMKVGGVRRLIIPAEKAYGAQSPAANIPPNSDLVFDIELTAIQ